MISLIRDFYTVGFQFARRLDPKRDPGAAAEYARHMCVLWAFLLLVLFVEVITALLGMPMSDLVGGNRVLHIVAVVGLLFVGNVVFKQIVSRIPTLRTAVEIERHHRALSSGRKLMLVIAALGTLVVILGIVAARQFLGWFGGV